MLKRIFHGIFFFGALAWAVNGHARDTNSQILGMSKSVVLADIVGGSQANGLNPKYQIQIKRSIAGGSIQAGKKLSLKCNCRLKTGSSYLAFIIDGPDGDYIRTAFEVLPPSDPEVRAIGLKNPIMLTANPSEIDTEPFVLTDAGPSEYEYRYITHFPGKPDRDASHVVAINSWYDLGKVERYIKKALSGSRQPVE